MFIPLALLEMLCQELNVILLEEGKLSGFVNTSVKVR